MVEIHDVLNALSELVYVSDPVTYELLFVNEPGIEMFQLGDYKGQKCHKVFQNLDEPCPFCTNALLREDRYHTWEFQNQVTGRYFMLKDKLVKWDGGRLARMEIAFDNTEERQRRLALQSMLESETVLVDCLRELHRSDDIRTSIQNILAIVGNFLQAQRVYIFSIHGASMDNTFEWCAPGISAEMENLQNLDIRLLDDWLADFQAGRCHILPSVEALKESRPVVYDVLSAQGIHALITAPMESDGKLIGYIGVDNPPMDKVSASETFFPALSFFLASALVKQTQADQLAQMSYLDYLTGLNNRNRYQLDLQALVADGCEQLGVVYLDLNGLKELNDRYGHLAGDQTLCALAALLCEVFGQHCSYRLGGDEFLALLPAVEESVFSHLVEQFNVRLEEKVLSCSVGFLYSADCHDVEDLVRQADEMMYIAKKNFYRGQRIPRRYRKQTDSVTTFAEDGQLDCLLAEGRFLLYFQPLVNVSTNVCEAGEALVRYVDESDVLVLPGDFLPRLVQMNTVHLLDFFMMESVMKMLTQRLADNLPVVPLSVNLSRKTLARYDFLSQLDALWSQYNLPHRLLRLEIQLDSDSPGDTAHLLESLTALRQRGFCVIVDDFGSLCANLYLFASARFDILKLDRTLILNSYSDHMKSAIIRSVTEVCHSMDISVVAQGVQDEAELRMLAEMGCDQYQGFLFTPALPAKEFWEICSRQ